MMLLISLIYKRNIRSHSELFGREGMAMSVHDTCYETWIGLADVVGSKLFDSVRFVAML